MSGPSNLLKRALTVSLVAFSSLLKPVIASTSPSPRQYCVWACNEATSYVTFEGSEELDYYTNLCANDLFLQSFAHCIQSYCTIEERTSGLKLQDDVCVTNAGINLPNLDDYTLPSNELAAIDEVDEALILESAEIPLDHAVIVSRDWFQTAYRTTAAHFKNRRLAYDFVWSMYGFWGLAIIVGLIYRFTELLTARRNGTGRYRPETSSMRLWIRKQLLLPATFGGHCQDSVGFGTIPPRLETLFLVVYLVMNIVFLFPGYDLFEGNLWYPTYSLQVSRYLGDRAGLLAIAQLPVVFVFAQRNDPLLWITGWSFATYNRFHRWVARLCMMLAIVHSVSYSVYTYRAGEGLYAASWVEEYWYCGVITIITMSLMIGTSIYVFRAKCYDVFLVVHVMLAVVLIVALWFHVKVFTGELNGFLWLCIAIWSFDRLLRLARVIYHGLIPRFAKGEKATATYDPSADIIRLDVTALLPDKIMNPGEYYYLYASSGIRSYQSHPFTLCSWQTRATTTTVQPSPSPTTTEDAKTPNPTTLSTSPSPSTLTQTCRTNHTLLIRPHNGFTASLKSRLSPFPKDITILLEGPYGHSVDLRPFTDVLFLVGGSGITAAISHLTLLLLLPSQRKEMNIHLLWAVPNASLVENVCENELAAVMREPGFRMTVYETRGLDSPGSSELEKNEDGKEVSRGGSPPAPAYTLLQGRPDLSSAIRDARQNCVGRSLAVVSCGPPRLADACRRGVVEVVGDGEGTGTGVEFFNEAMAW